MPLAKQKASRDRIQFAHSLSQREVDVIVSDPELRVLQCSAPVVTETWDLLNQSLFTRRPDIELRVYGFYSSVCDLSFLPRITNVRHFSADCLMQAVGIEYLSTLENLETLSVAISNLESFDFLASLPRGIKNLSLGATKSKKPRLELLRRFESLTCLYLEGQQKDIEVLSDLEKLEKLTLRSISISGLDPLVPLTKLSWLAIKLGGISDLSAIRGKDTIKYPELWQTRGLNDISVVSTLHGLQYLFLQSLKHVRSIPDLSRLAKLRRIWLENTKGLEDVSALQAAPCLEEFIHTTAQNMRPTQYEVLQRIPTLKRVLVGFGSDKKNKTLETLMSGVGVEKYRHRPFVFV